MEWHGVKINLAELAMVITAVGAVVAAWRGKMTVDKRRKGDSDGNNAKAD